VTRTPRLRLPSRKKRPGYCHFAGEHGSTDFQGFMEGAAVEGARAAEEIISGQ